MDVLVKWYDARGTLLREQRIQDSRAIDYLKIIREDVLRNEPTCVRLVVDIAL